MDKIADYDSCDHIVLSLGGGVQSYSIAVMAYSEKDYGIPEPNQIVFADTGNEPKFVYFWLERFQEWLNDRGAEIEIVKQGNLRQDTEEKLENDDRLVSIPAFADTEDGKRSAPLRRQCTREYKIDPIEKHVRKTLGFEPEQQMKGKVNVGVMLGISIDEIGRASHNNRTSWTTNLFPLLDIKYSRQDCKRIYEKHGLPAPKKSSCYFCPYHDDQYWYTLKKDHPEEFKKAVEFDKKIRDMSMKGVEKKIYLHRDCKPLDEIDFEAKVKGRGYHKSLFQQRSCGAFCGV